MVLNLVWPNMNNHYQFGWSGSHGHLYNLSMMQLLKSSSDYVVILPPIPNLLSRALLELDRLSRVYQAGSDDQKRLTYEQLHVSRKLDNAYINHYLLRYYMLLIVIGID